MLCRACIPHVPVTRALAIPSVRLAHTIALRHSAFLTSPSSSRTAPTPRDVLRTRTFSSTQQRRADEDPKMQRIFEQQQTLLNALQKKPEVLEYMKAFAEVLKQNGVDVHSGKIPGKVEMLRLMANSEVRESALKMANGLHEAGVDLKSKDLMQSLVEMQKGMKDK